MVLASTHGVTEEYTKVISNKINLTAKEPFHGLTVVITQENFLLMLKMATEYIPGQMVELTKENGSMESNMEMANLKMLKANKEKENGKTA